MLNEQRLQSVDSRLANAAAHHIVAGSSGRAAEARAILSRFGIDINAAENGVFLPRNSRVLTPPPGAVHSSLHTDAYYRRVEYLLGRATTREKAIEILSQIRQRLLAGRFP